MVVLCVCFCTADFHLEVSPYEDVVDEEPSKTRYKHLETQLSGTANIWHIWLPFFYFGAMDEGKFLQEEGKVLQATGLLKVT